MMLKTTNLKALWIVIAIFGLGMAAQAQTGKVGVNTDDPKATLHVKASAEMAGIIAPYVTGTTLAEATYGLEQDGAIAYVTDKTGGGNANQAQYVTEKGYYYFDAAAADNAGRWMRLVIGNPIKDNKVNWFYMPSIAVPTDDATASTDPHLTVSGGVFSLDLFSKYTEQFTNPKASSVTPSALPKFANATDFDYYITDYDESVLSEVAVNTNGVLTYKVLTTPTACSFINIVFVIK